MNELSVNISGAERQQIERKAIELFLKTARARHPDEDFYKNLTKRIFEDALDNFSQHIDNPLYKQMEFVSRYNLATNLRRLIFPDDLYVLTLNNTDYYTQMMDKNRYLAPIDTDDLVIPSIHIHNNKILFPFSKYSETELTISLELKEEINDYNEKMTTIYESLDAQLKALVNVINQCKTTKAFYAKLPNLTSLFPNSLRMKISRKNDTGEVELTEEQKLMQDATNSIATANLLED